jgi:hypothetical protein
MTEKEKLRLRVLAREIADDLFTYGVNEPAARLVQMTEPPERQLGGWGIGPATDRIYKHLLAASGVRKDPRG